MGRIPDLVDIFRWTERAFRSGRYVFMPRVFLDLGICDDSEENVSTHYTTVPMYDAEAPQRAIRRTGTTRVKTHSGARSRSRPQPTAPHDWYYITVHISDELLSEAEPILERLHRKPRPTYTFCRHCGEHHQITSNHRWAMLRALVRSATHCRRLDYIKRGLIEYRKHTSILT